MTKGTYVGLDVEVLEVEGVLPDVDADDGGVGQEGVLVGGRGDLETLGGWVQALQSDVSRMQSTTDERGVRPSPSRSPGWTQWWC